MFAIGLFFFIIGCLIGLLFKKEVRVCPSCKGELPSLGAARSLRGQPYPGQFDPPKKTPGWVWIVASVFVLAMIGAALNEQRRQLKFNQRPVSDAALPPPTISSSAPNSGAMTSADYLVAAKNALQDKRFADARRNIEAIKPGDKEYREAQTLLIVVKRQEARIKR